jgi:hypothetical protein
MVLGGFVKNVAFQYWSCRRADNSPESSMFNELLLQSVKFCKSGGFVLFQCTEALVNDCRIP